MDNPTQKIKVQYWVVSPRIVKYLRISTWPTTLRQSGIVSWGTSKCLQLTFRRSPTDLIATCFFISRICPLNTREISAFASQRWWPLRRPLWVCFWAILPPSLSRFKKNWKCFWSFFFSWNPNDNNNLSKFSSKIVRCGSGILFH